MTHDQHVLTPPEWYVMECLWEKAPCSGRDVVLHLKKTVGWSRSTTLTMLRRMTEKGMIDSATAIEVITQGMNDSFGGMMAKTAEEITGLWSNVTETAATAQSTIGTYLADSLDVQIPQAY